MHRKSNCFQYDYDPKVLEFRGKYSLKENIKDFVGNKRLIIESPVLGYGTLTLTKATPSGRQCMQVRNVPNIKKLVCNYNIKAILKRQAAEYRS